MKQAFFLKAYSAAWRLARPLLKRHKRLSAHFAERLVPELWPEDLMPAAARPDAAVPPFRLWIHAASGGEAYLAREIVAELVPRLPERDGIMPERAVLCTSMTEQGMKVLYEAQKELSGKNFIMAVNYFPLDEPALMLKALKQVFGPPSQAPRAVVLLETEIWPGLLAACREYEVRSYILNGRMTEGSFKAYRHIAGILRGLAPTAVLACTGDDAERFRALFDAPGAPTRVSLMPNIKFDRVVPADGKTDGNKIMRELLGENPPELLLFASVRQEEEKELLGVIGALHREAPKAAIVVAPRHMHRAEHWAEALGGLPGGDKHLKVRSKGLENIAPGDLVLWDAFGELAALYGSATAAFVGGSLAPLGGQNFLEPLAFGVVPVIGPSWSNFYWVGEEPFKLGLVKRVQNAAGLKAALLEQLENPPDKTKVKKSFGAYLKERRGGAKHAAEFIIHEFWGDR